MGVVGVRTLRKYGVKRGIWWWWWWLSGWLSGWWLSVVGKRLKVLEEDGKTDTPHRIAGSVSVRGVVACRLGESRHYGYLVKILNFAIMKIKFNEISPSMQGLKVEGGRLVNRMGDGQANVGVMGITAAAEMRKAVKQSKKEAMMTRAYVAAERLTERLEGPEGM